MRTPPSTVQPGGQALAVAIICVSLVGAWWPVAAPAEVPLYEVTVPLSGTGSAEREAGLVEALGAVAVKASGRRDAASSPAIRGANPAKYVQRYSTTADIVMGNGAPPVGAFVARDTIVGLEPSIVRPRT